MTAQFQFFQSLPHKRADFVKKKPAELGVLRVSVLEEFRISASDTVHCTVQYLSNSTITYDTNSEHLARGGERTRDPGRGHPEKGRSCNLVKYHIALLSQQVVKSH